MGASGALAAIGVAQKAAGFAIMPLIGLIMGAQPLIGYNYGARNWSRVLKTLKWACIWGVGIGTFFWVLSHVIPSQIVGLFGVVGELEGFAITALKIYTIMFPLVGFQIVGSSYFQSQRSAAQSSHLGTHAADHLPHSAVSAAAAHRGGVRHLQPGDDCRLRACFRPAVHRGHGRVRRARGAQAAPDASGREQPGAGCGISGRRDCCRSHGIAARVDSGGEGSRRGAHMQDGKKAGKGTPLLSDDSLMREMAHLNAVIGRNARNAGGAWGLPARWLS